MLRQRFDDENAFFRHRNDMRASSRFKEFFTTTFRVSSEKSLDKSSDVSNLLQISLDDVLHFHGYSRSCLPC